MPKKKGPPRTICKKCKKPPARGFAPNGQELRAYCRDCWNQICRERRTPAHSYRDRGYGMKRKYGITPAEHQRMIDAQGDRCAICDLPGKDSRWKTLHIDHDHQTGKIRGLLCNMCNVALGGFKDSIGMLEKAIDYLKEPPYSPCRE